MKQSDIITIVLITMIGTIAAGFITNAVLGNPDDASEKWKTIETVSADLSTPDPEVFNVDAINPTVEVYVGNCEDRDQDGVLSEGELIACGWMSAKEVKNNSEDADDSQNGTDDNTEDDSEQVLTLEEILQHRTQDTQSTTNSDGQTVETLDSDNTIVPNTVPSTETDENTSDNQAGEDESQESGGVAVPGVEL